MGDHSTADDRTPVRRAPPAFRRAHVVAVADLTPHLRRITLGGRELEGFVVPDPAASVRLLLPDDDGELVMPTWTGNQFELPDGARAPIRTLTPLTVDGDQLTVEIVLHHHGAMSDWARGAEVGDEVAISGPGRGYSVDRDASSFLVAGDETALPAIGQLLTTVPRAASVDVHVEIATADARLELPAHPGARVRWHVTLDERRPGDRLVAAVEAYDTLPEVIWVAGEAAAMQRIRTHLFDVRALARSRATVRGYWKQGRSAT